MNRHAVYDWVHQLSTIGWLALQLYWLPRRRRQNDAVVECSFSIERFASSRGYDAEFVFEDKAKRRRRYTASFMGRQQEILDRMPQIIALGTGRDALGIIPECAELD